MPWPLSIRALLIRQLYTCFVRHSIAAKWQQLTQGTTVAVFLLLLCVYNSCRGSPLPRRKYPDDCGWHGNTAYLINRNLYSMLSFCQSMSVPPKPTSTRMVVALNAVGISREVCELHSVLLSQTMWLSRNSSKFVSSCFRVANSCSKEAWRWCWVVCETLSVAPFLPTPRQHHASCLIVVCCLPWQVWCWTACTCGGLRRTELLIGSSACAPQWHVSSKH